MDTAALAMTARTARIFLGGGAFFDISAILHGA